MKRATRPDPFPFSPHLRARRGRQLIVADGTHIHAPPGQDGERFLALMEVRPSYTLVVPRYNGSPEADSDVVRWALSAPTLRSIAAVCRAGGDKLSSDAIEELAHRQGGHARAVLAWYGRLFDGRGRATSYDRPGLIPLDLSSWDFVATFLYWQRHAPVSRVGAYIKSWKVPS